MSQSLIEKALCLFAKVFWFSLALFCVGTIWLSVIIAFSFSAPNIYSWIRRSMPQAQSNDDSFKALALAEKYTKKYGSNSNLAIVPETKTAYFEALAQELAKDPEKALVFLDAATSDSTLSLSATLFRARLEYKTGNLQGAFTDYCAATDIAHAQQFTKINEASELSEYDISKLRKIIREITPVVNEGVVTTAFNNYDAFLDFLREQSALSESPESYDDAIAFWEKLGKLSVPFVKAPKWDFRNWSGGHDWYYWEKEFQLDMAKTSSFHENDGVALETSSSEQAIMKAEE